jgi:hypothetical protein
MRMKGKGAAGTSAAVGNGRAIAGSPEAAGAPAMVVRLPWAPADLAAIGD